MAATRRFLLAPADAATRWTLAGACIGGATVLAFARAGVSVVRWAR